MTVDKLGLGEGGDRGGEGGEAKAVIEFKLDLGEEGDSEGGGRGRRGR